MARLSYEPEVTIRTLLEQNWKISFDNPNNEFYFISVIHTQVYVVSTGDNIVVVFRGTEPFNLADWYTDSLFRMRPLGATSPIQFRNCLTPKLGLKVSMAHCGFLDALEVFDFKQSSVCCLIELYSHLVRLISINPNRPIFICGHSLGGALTNVFSFMLHSIYSGQGQQQSKGSSALAHNNLLNIDTVLGGVYTFGAPRCFNDTAKEEYHNSISLRQRTFRFVLDNDLVPQLPNNETNDNFPAPPNIITGLLNDFLKKMTQGTIPRPYHHVGNAIHFKRLSETGFEVECKDPTGAWLAKEDIASPDIVRGVDLAEKEPLLIRSVRKIGREVVPYIVDHHPDSYEKLCTIFATKVTN